MGYENRAIRTLHSVCRSNEKGAKKEQGNRRLARVWQLINQPPANLIADERSDSDASSDQWQRHRATDDALPAREKHDRECEASYNRIMTTEEVKALPVDAIWEDFRERFDRMEIPQEQKDLLDQRRARVREGKARLLNWDSVKGTIGRR
jgi:Putative addiction module component